MLQVSVCQRRWLKSHYVIKWKYNQVFFKAILAFNLDRYLDTTSQQLPRFLPKGEIPYHVLPQNGPCDGDISEPNLLLNYRTCMHTHNYTQESNLDATLFCKK